MGFYGNATYYLPNGIAQDVVDGVITEAKIGDKAVTPNKLDRTYLEHQGLAQIQDFDALLNFCKSFPEKKIQWILLNSQIDYENKHYPNLIPHAIKLEKGYYYIIKESMWYYLFDLNKGKFYQLQIDNNGGHALRPTYLNSENIAFEQITGGTEKEKGHLAQNTITNYNIDNNAITKEKIQTESIQGSLGTKINESGESSSHIAPGSIGSDDIGDNSISTTKIQEESIQGSQGTKTDTNGGPSSHIAPGSIGKTDLFNSFWEFQLFEYDSENSTQNFIDQLLTFKASFSLSDPIIIIFQLNVPIVDFGLSSGFYIGWTAPPYSSTTIYLNNLDKNEHWILNNAKVLKRIQIASDDIKNSQIHGSGDSDENHNHIAPGSIGSDDIAKNTITPDKLDRQYHETYLLQSSSYTLQSLAEEIYPVFLASGNKSICFHSSNLTEIKSISGPQKDYFKITYSGIAPGSLGRTNWIIESTSYYDKKYQFQIVYSPDSSLPIQVSKPIELIAWSMKKPISSFDNAEELYEALEMEYQDQFSTINIKQKGSVEQWNSSSNENAAIPEIGRYLLIGQKNISTIFLIGLTNKKQYSINFPNSGDSSEYYTIEVI